jgi:1,4-alpha-glucan branching enzyme
MMKYIYSFVLALILHFAATAQQQTVTYSVSPTPFNETQAVTITINGSSVNETAWGISNNALYMWAWSYDHATNTSMDCPTNGPWTASGTANKFVYSAGTDTYSLTFVPTTFFNRTGLSKMGFLVKALDGTGDKKSQDIYVNIGTLQFNTQTPAKNSVTAVNSGTPYPINYTASLPSNWVLTANGIPVTTVSNSTTFNYAYTVTADATMLLTATSVADATSINSTFNFIINPTVQTAAIPSYMRQGISYHPTDQTKIGLALYAPNKAYVHVIGSFNGWALSSPYVMKRDTTDPNLYWIEITGLTPQQVYTFQYRTNDGVKVADPYSTMVLSPDDDPYIQAADFPNLPVYPAGQQFDVSVVQTGMPAYSWAVTNFQKPAKQNLLVYELLVRDFTVEQNWQSMIDKIPYLKSLNINAVELMPVMEFDGNNSWGYNTSFHNALDKAYGTPNKFKEFIDKCHQNGIAVILDIALNHATGRNPLQRLWSTSTDGSYGGVAATNPYFNQNATHAYSVFYDFNHSKPETKYYVNRVLERWISEYKIDGFRWDLTKGFTQNCTSGDETCTNASQADRIATLKTYADYQWSYDPTSFIIFEHLGTDAEEQQWANYRLSEGKGIMTWDKLTTPYNQNTMGYATDSNFSRVDFENHGFAERRNVSYPESHDEERIMFKNITYGATNGIYDAKDLGNALQRQKALAAVFLPVPGPKMLWQFAELGYDQSIFRCVNGTNNFPDNAADGPGDCKLDSKPSAFELFYDFDPVRTGVKDSWSKMMNLKRANQVFDTTTFTVESGNLTPRIYIWNDALPTTGLKNVVILANFTLVPQNIVPNFPYTGSWYNLMDDTPLTVSNTTTPVTLLPGEFRIFGNKAAAVLGTHETAVNDPDISLELMQNPVISQEAKFRYTNAKGGTVTVFDFSGKVVKTAKVTGSEGEMDIAIHGLAAGTYLVQLRAPQGSAVTKMTVK